MRATRTGAFIYLTTALVLASPPLARGMLPGGGNPATDCFAEFEAPRLRLSYPPFDPAKPKPGREVRCFDGDPACDLDGAVNHSCQFDVDVCLFNADPALPTCSATTVSAVKVSGTTDPDLMALSNALAALLPASSNVCTSGRTLAVPLKATPTGAYRRATKVVRISAKASATDGDALKLTCVPRGWPSHGYDERNRRATAVEGAITPANASTLTEKWTLDLQAREGGAANGVTSTPTVGDGKVFVTSWNGNVYAVDAASGKVRWTYDTGTGGGQGVQSSATLTADGRVLVGDSVAVLHCLDAKKGKLLWKSTLGNAAVDQIWGSPTVANGRVYMGIASHNDNPCTQGRVVALDLDTGVTLWLRKMVPDRVCDNDTAVACSVDAECGAGTCVPARGAGVTATVAVDPVDDAIYLNTVGCYTFPSVGDSDSIMKLDGSTGGAQWIRRVQPPEQFQVCNTDPSIECTPSTVCPAAGSCAPKAFYHDFGFLNGPLLVDADDGLGGTRSLVVSGSKDGSLYALDPTDGSIVWQRAVLPTPVTPAFAGFGLFDGAIAFADDRFHAALYDFIPAAVPAPPHRQAFSAVDGSTLWFDDIGTSWGAVSLGGGVSYAGTLAVAGLYVHDAATGARLTTLDLPSVTSSGASIVDGTVYVGYGIFGAPGGVRAFTLP